MVEYTDADNPEPRTRLVGVLPGTPGTVFFLDDKVVGKQAQGWFKEQVLRRWYESAR